jgi:hypothetical protein
MERIKEGFASIRYKQRKCGSINLEDPYMAAGQATYTMRLWILEDFTNAPGDATLRATLDHQTVQFGT